MAASGSELLGHKRPYGLVNVPAAKRFKAFMTAAKTAVQPVDRLNPGYAEMLGEMLERQGPREIATLLYRGFLPAAVALAGKLLPRQLHEARSRFPHALRNCDTAQLQFVCEGLLAHGDQWVFVVRDIELYGDSSRGVNEPLLAAVLFHNTGHDFRRMPKDGRRDQDYGVRGGEAFALKLLGDKVRRARLAVRYAPTANEWEEGWTANDMYVVVRRPDPRALYSTHGRARIRYASAVLAHAARVGRMDGLEIYYQFVATTEICRAISGRPAAVWHVPQAALDRVFASGRANADPDTRRLLCWRATHSPPLLCPRADGSDAPGPWMAVADATRAALWGLKEPVYDVLADIIVGYFTPAEPL